jgi:hypothetical protein
VTREPISATGHVLLVGDRAHDVATLALRNLLGMTNLTLLPDGRPVPLSFASLGLPPSLSGHAAASAGRAAVAVGPASVATVTRSLEAPTPALSPLASLGMDISAWRERGLLDDEDGRDEELRDIAIQLEVIPDGIALEMFATFPAL